MVKLFCAIVGVVGSAFSVRVDESDEPESVDDLKEAIKKKKPDTIKGEADKLQLFLAKKADSKWVPDDHTLDALLQRGDVTSFEEMRAS
ncbi:hypothetical protein PF005_g32580 [Phytophthora fragariae]|uniref:Crinkler effector protein N-terminal domain-containing protein n=1 Tax=Phytophthora fragariae TaxID=53985 RepID=A0A6A3PF16_9STRA|nr:hypothetical protein PF003_g31713 [Phytophthora fragariae]KAE8917180.1 hypothetical protein PF009_g32497 [Phytophthora fragariae]KAE9055370.1 hypothetical protein PF010_g32175 [Phytophthora fragariae]KAE9055808.1 hypothetical protein PF007_g32192 [Phytophthora fragariae]KAE9057233.1 hypothetical protein PF006_g32477 [Phytophthora fragariae]